MPVGRKQGGSTSPNRAWKKGLTAAQAPAGRPNQSPGCVALQGRPNPGWSNTNSMKPCRGDPHPKCVSYQYRATARSSARRVAPVGLFPLGLMAYPGFGCPCRATHPGLWRDRPYRGFASLSTSWKEARWSTSPTALGRRLNGCASWGARQLVRSPNMLYRATARRSARRVALAGLFAFLFPPLPRVWLPLQGYAPWALEGSPL